MDATLEGNHVRKLGENYEGLFDLVAQAQKGISTVGGKVAELRGEFTDFREETGRRFDQLQTLVEEVDARATVRTDALEERMRLHFSMADERMRIGFAKADAKVDRGFAAADERANQLNSKIDNVHVELTQKVEALDGKVDTLESKIDLILGHLKIG